MTLLENTLQSIKKERGEVANIHKAFLEFPEGISAHYEFYKNIILKTELPLSRVQREYLAFKTSEANQCPYCINHHKAAFENQGQDLKTEVKNLFSEFAFTLTKDPWKANLFRDKFNHLGFSEKEWQQAIFIVSYFNFANRLAFAMNLEVEENYKESCQ